MGCEQSKSTTHAVTGIAPQTRTAPTAAPPTGPRLLAVIVVHYNPQHYQRRAVLVNECLQRLQATRERILAQQTQNPVRLILQAVELTYDNDPPELQDSLLADVGITRRKVSRERNIMWSKEQLINLAINDLVPNIEHVVWLDSDIGFEDDSWVEAAFTKLSQNPLAFGQVWGTCQMLGPNREIQRTVTSFAMQMSLGKQYKDLSNRHLEYWHPGFAWMATRKALRATNGLLDRTLGSADRHMAMAFLGRAAESVPTLMHHSYTKKVMNWQKAVQDNKIKFVVVPAVIRHYWHGSLRQRGYMGRWKILLDYNFDPDRHLDYDEVTGLYEWNEECPLGLITAICEYFADRLEDSDDVQSDDVQVDNVQSDDVQVNEMTEVLCGDEIEFPSHDTGQEPSAPYGDTSASDYGAQMAAAAVTHDAYTTALTSNDAFSFYA